MWADSGLIFVIVAAYAISKRRYHDIFTPLFVYISMWCFCLFLFRLRLINYDELETPTELLIGGSMLAFALGCFCAGKPRKTQNVTVRFTFQRSSMEKAIKVLLLINFIGLCLYIQRLGSAFGLSSLALNPGEINRNVDEFGRIGVLAFFILVNYPAFVCSLFHYLETRRLFWFTALGLTLPLAQSYVFGDRNTLAIPVATSVFVWVYFNGWRALNGKIAVRLLGTVALIIGYFLVAGFLYGRIMSTESPLYKEADYSTTSETAILFANPYLYATSSFPTMQAAMADVHGLLWGTRTFFPAARILYGAGVLRDRPENASLEFYFVPVPSNVFTYLFSFYEDFGIMGVAFFPFLLGFAETKAYTQMKAGPSVFRVGCVASLMVVNLYSVFIALNSTLLFWNYLLVMFTVSAVCESRSRRVTCAQQVRLGI
jgi:oligosaccharide repeat unit polymerase